MLSKTGTFEVETANNTQSEVWNSCAVLLRVEYFVSEDVEAIVTFCFGYNYLII